MYNVTQKKPSGRKLLCCGADRRYSEGNSSVTVLRVLSQPLLYLGTEVLGALRLFQIRFSHIQLFSDLYRTNKRLSCLQATYCNAYILGIKLPLQNPEHCKRLHGKNNECQSKLQNSYKSELCFIINKKMLIV